MKRRDFLTVSASAALGLASGARLAHANALNMPAEHRFARANYIPGAPLRDTVGEGKIIRGQVLSLETGGPVPGTEIEYWLNTTADAGGIGEQNPANRGEVVADENGRFRFETNPPQRVMPSAAPHTHTRVSADGRAPFFYRHETSNTPSTDDVTAILQRT